MLNRRGFLTLCGASCGVCGYWARDRLLGADKKTERLAVCSTRPRGGGPAKKLTGLESVISTDSKLWKAGAELTVVFYDGDEKAQKRVAEIASEWTKHANLKFRFYTEKEYADLPQNRLRDVEFGPEYRKMTKEDKRKAWRKAYWTILPEIAITFQGAGYNSAIATDSYFWTREGEHSMRLGGLDKVEDKKEWQRVVLHEFGHALGLQHEHKNPVAGIKWNVPLVSAHYKGLSGWYTGKPEGFDQYLKQQVLDPLQASKSQYSKFDPMSIMVYAFPAEHTTNGFSVPWNSELSETDKAFIAQLYSFRFRASGK